VVAVVLAEVQAVRDPDQAALMGEWLAGEGLNRAAEGEQVELGPGEIAVFGTPGAVGSVSEPGGVPPIAAFESRDHCQHEYCENDDSGHGSNYALRQIPPQLA
jgi:hypothetical protein